MVMEMEADVDKDVLERFYLLHRDGARGSSNPSEPAGCWTYIYALLLDPMMCKKRARSCSWDGNGSVQVGVVIGAGAEALRR
jgi:hypothetical protein